MDKSRRLQFSCVTLTQSALQKVENKVGYFLTTRNPIGEDKSVKEWNGQGTEGRHKGDLFGRGVTRHARPSLVNVGKAQPRQSPVRRVAVAARDIKPRCTSSDQTILYDLMDPWRFNPSSYRP